MFNIIFLYLCYIKVRCKIMIEVVIMEKVNDLEMRALRFATIKHKDQIRFDGSPYINHPIRVSNNVRRFKKSKMKSELVAAAYLHDTLEDTDTTYEELIRIFGVSCASLVLEVTSNQELKQLVGKTKYLEILMKNMSSYALVIKLCDRLDNIRDLENASSLFRIKYVKETLDILKYVMFNRNLSKTHLLIMYEISKSLLDLSYNYDELSLNKGKVLSLQSKIIV